MVKNWVANLDMPMEMSNCPLLNSLSAELLDAGDQGHFLLVPSSPKRILCNNDRMLPMG